MTQPEKADLFGKQHKDDKILLLPNVWDTISARLIASAGFQSLATASFSIAAANGYEDGEKIPFDRLVKVVAEITNAVDLPVSVDFERGYANDLRQLADNVNRLLDAGAIGVNIEDRSDTGKDLVSTDAQCRKIEIIREAGVKYGVNIFINARTDAFLLKVSNYVDETIQRGNAFRSAGADCFYPVLVDNYADIERICGTVSLPVNVLLMKPAGDLKKLQDIGVKRISLGPGSLKYVLTKLRNMASDLMRNDTTEFFRDELISNGEVMGLVKQRS
jgi:2-methylisocitrate lyase-like PEP mutase family enzyme